MREVDAGLKQWRHAWQLHFKDTCTLKQDCTFNMLPTRQNMAHNCMFCAIVMQNMDNLPHSNLSSCVFYDNELLYARNTAKKLDSPAIIVWHKFS